MVLASVRIVLVEPAGALNLGSVARIMKNMGLHRLVLVNPQCDRLSPEARQMAVHAADVLEAAEQVETLPEALQGCQRAIATTGRDRTTLNMPLESPRRALPWLVAAPASPASAALIFGREDRGLTNEELNHAQRLIHIPASPGYPSLNLAQAVAICCYELHVWAIAEQNGSENAAIERPENTPFQPAPFPAPSSPPIPHSYGAASSPPPADLAPLDALNAYYQHLEALLLKIGYLYPHTAASRMKKFRRLFNRAYPSANEVALLQGMLSQVEWALEQRNNQEQEP